MPIHLYTTFYYYSLLIIVFITLLSILRYKVGDLNSRSLRVVGFMSLLYIVFYIGLRPLSELFFGDMAIYAQMFENYKLGQQVVSTRDPAFHLFMKYCSSIMTIELFFLVCSFLYIIPLYLVCKKWFKNYWFFGFIFLAVSFSFWDYGVNGIRNGIAGSFFLLAISRNKRKWQILWILTAVLFHKAMILPTAGFIISNIYNKPKKFILFWLICIPLSLMGAGFFEKFIGNFSFNDDRISYFQEDGININEDLFTKIGFRWDFLIYSAAPIFIGGYYIIKRKFNDKVYFNLFNTYVLANAFWILVIRATFSNRFAYLSWFMMGLVIIYPLFKSMMYHKTNKQVGIILIIYFSFTFLLKLFI